MLIRQGRTPGASLDELAKALGFGGKDLALGRMLVIEKLIGLGRVLKVLGLRIVYIPQSRHFTIAFSDKFPYEYSSDIPMEIFKTLEIIIKHFRSGEDYIDIATVSRERGVAITTLKSHLRELEIRGYVDVRRDRIYRTPKLIVLIEGG